MDGHPIPKVGHSEEQRVTSLPFFTTTHKFPPLSLTSLQWLTRMFIGVDSVCLMSKNIISPSPKTQNEIPTNTEKDNQHSSIKAVHLCHGRKNQVTRRLARIQSSRFQKEQSPLTPSGEPEASSRLPTVTVVRHICQPQLTSPEQRLSSQYCT